MIDLSTRPLLDMHNLSVEQWRPNYVCEYQPRESRSAICGSADVVALVETGPTPGCACTGRVRYFCDPCLRRRTGGSHIRCVEHPDNRGIDPGSIRTVIYRVRLGELPF